jgi:hypothetical protein
MFLIPNVHYIGKNNKEHKSLRYSRLKETHLPESKRTFFSSVCDSNHEEFGNFSLSITDKIKPSTIDNVEILVITIILSDTIMIFKLNLKKTKN